MQRSALDVLGQRVLLGEAIGPHHAWHGLSLLHALLLDQQLEGPKPTAAGRHLEHTGLVTVGVHDPPDIQARQEGAPGDVFGKLLDGNAGLQPAHVGLAQHQLIEGNVA